MLALFSRSLLLAATLTCLASPSKADQRLDEVVLRVEGDVEQPLALSATDFAALPRSAIDLPDREGVIHRFEGVRISDLLAAARPVYPADQHGAEFRFALIVQAQDGYSALFSRAEVDPRLATEPAIIADRRDGEPLPDGVGPLRVIVPSDVKPERWVKQAQVLTVRYL